MTNTNGNQFLPEELVTMRHYDKRTGQWRESDYPKVGGRLRLAHGLNGSLDISTEIIKYDGNVAVVKALCSTDKGSYTGISMASVERDAKIAPAILELAETRAIARALRFAGYGVEYCSAEEVSHLDSEKEDSSYPPVDNIPLEQQEPIYHQTAPVSIQPGNGSYGNRSNGNNGNGNGQSRLSQKQHSFLLSLADDRSITRKELDTMSRERYGCVVSFLSKNDASSFIGELTGN
ncbi:hypothetical protein [Desulfogranum marinum]|uniref:hypothetical protein n=1 Tax=Desulfogranum marinum TaxID=453220 RepID=UPI00196656B8|nr:hypothetical protein [Desulfogranum marinum]MBM9515298.1 hypothetical protein [Desulfogranum marinum]